MKSAHYFCFLILLMAISCDTDKSHSFSTGTAGNGPVIFFEESKFDFGTIKQGEVVNHIFKFKNTGTAPLIIKNVSTQCGCTVPTKPEKPVQPGEASEIKVQFNSSGKKGAQKKLVTITANTQPEESIIEIRAEVNN